MQKTWRQFVLGLIAGAMLCWLFVAVSAGWYDYQLWGDSRCQTIKERGMQFESGTEIVPGQPNPCYHRTARFHLP